MAATLPNPGEWLNAQMEKLHITQNEFARRAKISSSALTNFASGDCGPQTAINIANYLGIPATHTLAMVGFVPPPPSYDSVNVELISYIYQRLDDGRRKELMNYADYLRAQMEPSTITTGST